MHSEAGKKKQLIENVCMKLTLEIVRSSHCLQKSNIHDRVYVLDDGQQHQYFHTLRYRPEFDELYRWNNENEQKYYCL